MPTSILMREKGILGTIAKHRWDAEGPGVMIGRIESGLILDNWIPLGNVRDKTPEQIPNLMSLEAWTWLRSNALSDGNLESATRENIPVIFCLPLPKCPHPEIDFFWSQ